MRNVGTANIPLLVMGVRETVYSEEKYDRGHAAKPKIKW
jgi:DNA/RNA endonuclease G (NUC1)